MPTGASNSNDGAVSSFTEPLDEQGCEEILQTLSAVEGERVLLCWPRIGLSTHLEYSQVDISFGDVSNKSESRHLAVFKCSGAVRGRAGTQIPGLLSLPALSLSGSLDEDHGTSADAHNRDLLRQMMMHETSANDTAHTIKGIKIVCPII
jgi:hypothetical protein